MGTITCFCGEIRKNINTFRRKKNTLSGAVDKYYSYFFVKIYVVGIQKEISLRYF